MSSLAPDPRPGSGTALIDIEGLSRSYGAVRALSGLTLRIAEGPCGLLGPNGAGKTTLIKLLLGLLEPDEGRVRVAGHDPRRGAGRLALRRSVGYMPEGDCLIPGATGVELVITLGRLSGLTDEDARARAHEVLDYVGLDEARYRETGGWSTGMKQRLKLAQALVHDPPLLLLDEPTNGLDPQGRREMLELVRDLGWNQGKSLLLCSHLLPDVERTCRDVIVLSRGRAVAQGAIEELTRCAGRWVRARLPLGGVRLAQELGAAGFACREVGEQALEVQLGAEGDSDPLFAAAARAAASLSEVEPLRTSLEQVFLSTLAGDAP